MNKKHSLLKPLIVIIVAALVIAAGYAVFAYTTDRWPFDPANQATDSHQAASETTTKKKAEATKPQYNLKFTTEVKADEQGDCTLTMTMGDHTLTQENSTKGKKGKTGCGTWKLDTSDMPAGKYEVKVVFAGETSHETSTRTITIPEATADKK